jgi:hypothetical protein
MLDCYISKALHKMHQIRLAVLYIASLTILGPRTQPHNCGKLIIYLKCHLITASELHLAAQCSFKNAEATSSFLCWCHTARASLTQPTPGTARARAILAESLASGGIFATLNNRLAVRHRLLSADVTQAIRNTTQTAAKTRAHFFRLMLAPKRLPVLLFRSSGHCTRSTIGPRLRRRNTDAHRSPSLTPTGHPVASTVERHVTPVVAAPTVGVVEPSDLIDRPIRTCPVRPVDTRREVNQTGLRQTTAAIRGPRHGHATSVNIAPPLLNHQGRTAHFGVWTLHRSHAHRPTFCSHRSRRCPFLEATGRCLDDHTEARVRPVRTPLRQHRSRRPRRASYLSPRSSQTATTAFPADV